MFTKQYGTKKKIKIPVAHHDGNIIAEEDVLNRLEAEGQIAFRYDEECNGSRRNIAGVLNERGNVLGMMPHPERAIEDVLGSSDGKPLFDSIMANLMAR